MSTITIQTNNLYARKLYQKLRADKNLDKVILKETEKQKPDMLPEVKLILAGKPLTDEELITSIAKAARGKSLSIKDARKKSLSKIAAWRKAK